MMRTLPLMSGLTVVPAIGGIRIDMSPSAPDTYHGVFELSGERLDYTAALGASNVLSVRGNNLGCKWSGKSV
jgi:hypothetical protein